MSLVSQASGEPAARTRVSARRVRQNIEGYICIAPWLVGFFVFTLAPMVFSLYLSFTQWELAGAAPTWVGLDNFKRLLTDRNFSKSLYNTAYYAVFMVPSGATLAFLLAVLLNQEVRGRALFRTLFYIPAITPAVASAVLWLWMLQPQFGLINMGLRVLGVAGPNWLGRTTWVKPAIILMGLWGQGQSIIIFLAGLQGVPRSLYEAAEVDGANSLQQFLHVTLPMMTPTIFFVLVMGLIGAMQAFTQAYVLTQGGPANASLFYVLYLYLVGFRYFNISYASVLAWVLFVIILILTLIQFKLSSRWVYYEGEGASQSA
ncbi:MAG: carbohydrate ABC transporter permease [Anaerolineae bacterium]|jgi:multiple sugar transport system permease protein